MARFLLLASLPILLFAKGKTIYEAEGPNLVAPWLTGPLITPSAYIIPVGHVNVEPYLYAVANTGAYGSNWKSIKKPNFWSIYSQTTIQIGLTSQMSFQFNPTAYWQHTQHQASWAFGDMPIALDIQLYHARQSSKIPNVKLSLREILPTGKYRNLGPNKLKTDAGGAGAWNTGFALILGNIYDLSGVHFFNYRLALIYAAPSPVHLKGFTFYGGGFGTDGRFYPPQSFQLELGLEFTLAQKWAFALDLVGGTGKKPRFTGQIGTDADGAPASFDTKAQTQFSLAPAIEYNWNADCGIVFGSWFTVAGRNSPIFSSGVFAFNGYF